MKRWAYIWSQEFLMSQVNFLLLLLERMHDARSLFTCSQFRNPAYC